MAEGILRRKAMERNLHIEVDSCGFESFHVGDTPDPRAIRVAAQMGTDISKHRARLFSAADFVNFDQIYVMDQSHYSQALRLAGNDDKRRKVEYLLNVVYPGQNREVKDPWYYDFSAFEVVYRELDLACEAIVNNLELKQHEAC